MLWTARKRFHTMTRIGDTARSRAASAPQGRVEFQGVAWPEDGQELRSANGAEVVYYALEIQREEKRRSSRGSRTTWVTAFSWTHAPDFFLVDATGLVRVAAGSAEFDLLNKRTQSWTSLPEVERQRVLGHMAGRTVPGFPPSEAMFGLFSANYRLRESEIRVGSPLYAHGDFRTAGTAEVVEANGLTAFHQQFFDAARREAKDLGALLGARHTDELSAGEAGDGLAVAAASAREAARATTNVESSFRVTGRIGSSPESRLFVADRHEEHLSAGMGRSALGPAIGGLAALATAAYLLVAGSPDLQPTGTSRAAPPASSGHEELRKRCMDGQRSDCEQLLLRADELHISEAFRRAYAQRACSLGSQAACGATKQP